MRKGGKGERGQALLRLLSSFPRRQESSFCLATVFLLSTVVFTNTFSLGSESPTWSATVSDRTVANYPDLRESIWTLSRPPSGQYDTIAVRRITRASTNREAQRPVFVFLPSAHMHGEIIIADERYDLRLYLANRGVETWTLDYRTHTVTHDDLRDSRIMETWTVETFVEDAATAADFVRTISGQQQFFVGGFGRGATFAALMAARFG